MWWSIFLIIIIFIFTILLSVVGILQELIRAGKWIGLGAIFGNALNNKVNADSANKSGRFFRKKRIKTGSKMTDWLVNFISPSNEDDMVGEQIEEDVVSKSDYDEFQEYLQWKKWKNSQESNDKIND